MAEEGEMVELEEKPADTKIPEQTIEVGQDAKSVAEEDDDERVGHDDTGENSEERRERNRQERREKKKRRNEYRERDALEMRFLRQRNEELERTQTQLDQRVTLTEAAAIDQRVEAITAQIAQANDVMGKANAAQDSATYTEALAIKDQLQKSLTRLEAAKADRLQEARRPASQQQMTPQVSREQQDYAAIFLRENPWYDPAARDEDSAIAQAIDARLVAEGLKPDTKKYWDELRSRLRKRLPDKFATSDQDGDPDDDDDDDALDDEPPRSPAAKAQTRPAKRDAPNFPSGGAGKPLKAGQFYVSSERKAAMIEAGVWEDKSLRDRMLRRYQKFDRDNRSSK